MQFQYDLADTDAPRIGLIVLQADETVESDFRSLLPDTLKVLVSRVPSGLDVTPESLQETATHLTQAAQLFPDGLTFDSVGFACTSASAQIGSAAVTSTVQAGMDAAYVTNPLAALIAACRVLGIKRLAFLSPYIESVSDQLRAVLQEHEIATPVFGTFAESQEARVARISASSISDAARALCKNESVDALFLSCTNLKTLPVLQSLETELGIPVLSSNLVLAWHVWSLAAPDSAPATPSGGLREND